MYHNYYLLLQGFLLLASLEELSFLNNGALYQVSAFKTKRSCQDDTMNLHCPAPKVLKIYCATYHQTKSDNCARKSEYCAPVDKISLISERCKGKMACNVTVDTSTMGDNCPGMLTLKYLKVTYLCGPPIVNDTDQYRDIKIKYICQGDSMYLSCTASEVLNIIQARYGREKKDKNKICIGRRMDYVNTAEYCADDKEDFVKGRCEGHTKCNFTVDTSTMGDKCPGMSVHKDLNVMYGCVEKVSPTPPTTVPPTAFAENKSTTVLTKPSSPSAPFNYATQSTTTEMSPKYPDDNDEEDDSAGYGFVIYNTGYGNQISHVMTALLFVVNFHFQPL